MLSVRKFAEGGEEIIIRIIMSLAEAKILNDVMKVSNRKIAKSVKLAKRGVRRDPGKQGKLDETMIVMEEKFALTRKILKGVNTGEDLITYEFSPDEIKRMLIVLDDAIRINKIAIARDKAARKDSVDKYAIQDANRIVAQERKEALRIILYTSLRRAGYRRR